LLGDHGAKGVSHLKVDRKAGVPDGTTSAYYRTSAALLCAVAERLAELDRADLQARLDLLRSADHAAFESTPSLLAIAVMASATEPNLSRTKARYELALQASRDPEMGRLVQQDRALFIELFRNIVMQLQPPGFEEEAALIDDQVFATVTFVNGLMLILATGDSTIQSAEEVDRFLSAITTGLRVNYERDQAKQVRECP
jgi:DNA-binding transcriptional regulator YbjK